ncbi:MAG: DUF1214 domain-containing protein [Holophagaceae bacterium]|nr:DUF1214 domain-containing protein [Holophagaceae bacterium]
MKDDLSQRWVGDSLKFTLRMGQWNLWGDPIAKFGTEYSYRALIAQAGIGANPVTSAIYPSTRIDRTGEPLDGKNAYIIHFDSVPPVGEYGFWSVTAYGEDNFLIDNEINRYSINDRNQVKFNDDGSLDILVQAYPPEDKTMAGNWLPVKEDSFHLHLRIYLPHSDVLDSKWAMPEIIKQ